MAAGCGTDALRLAARATSGGGGMTAVAIGGSVSLEFREPGTGTGPGLGVNATKLGKCISCASFTSGGVTMVCE